MYFELFAKFLLIIGGLNYFFTSIFNIDLFALFQYPGFIRLLSILIGLSAIYFMFNRDYYLPFLGYSVIPVGSQTTKSVENLTKIKLSGLPPNTTVIAWGSQNANKIFDNPLDAYGDYQNTEIKKTDNKGDVIIELPCPAEYYVNKFGLMQTKLNKHIHYRYELPQYKGLFSRIYTRYLDAQCQ